MKRICAFTLLCILVFSLCACSEEYQEKYALDGIENYRCGHSNYELDVYLLPSESFLEDFAYTSIDYHYRAEYKTYISISGGERILLFAEYEQEEYEKAKEYCLQNFQLEETYQLEYNGYHFIENIKLAVGQERYKRGMAFPRDFNMFAYNDELNRLVFIGFYGAEYSNEDAQDVQNNWGAFLEKHFSDLYDWK